MDAEQTLNSLEQGIKELKHEYELFFAGEIRVEPLKLRRQVRMLILDINRLRLSNTGMKFRFLSLQGTFNSFQRLWDRTLIEIEQGTYSPHRFKADYHVGKLDKKTGQVIESEIHKKTPGHLESLATRDPVQKLYEEFLEARKLTRETGKISIESFRKSLDAQKPVLQKKFGGAVAFKISVEDGRAKVKGVKV
jgi:hypothetical protein